ncbi:hypothetical protein C8R43DRAFT_993453 [Mycena crocata]|nr:hypothetical protein C8R43DRAFT_993453 [Mycena crocata]
MGGAATTDIPSDHVMSPKSVEDLLKVVRESLKIATSGMQAGMGSGVQSTELQGNSSYITDTVLEDILRTLLADPAVLPAGGFLAFGLAQKYPLPAPLYLQNYLKQTPAARWGAVLESLTGSDARIRSIFQHLSLFPVVKVLYSNPDSGRSGFLLGNDVVADDLVDLSQIYEYVTCFGEPETAEQALYAQGVVLQRDDHRMGELHRVREQLASRYGPNFQGWGDEHLYVTEAQQKASGTAVQTHWITDIGEQNRVSSAYVGQDSMVDFMYGTAALFVQVPSMGEGIRAAVRAL